MKKILTLLFVIAFPFLTFDHALGCGCGGDPLTSDEERRAALVRDFTLASAVFSGEVVELDTFKVKFKVDKLWKGEPAKEITMLTGTIKVDEGLYRSSSCDYRFQKDKKYLVYAYGAFDELKTHVCSRIKLIVYAEQEMEQLDDIAPRKSDQSKLRRYSFNPILFSQFWTPLSWNFSTLAFKLFAPARLFSSSRLYAAAEIHNA